MTLKDFYATVADTEGISTDLAKKAEELLAAIIAKENKAEAKRKNDPERKALTDGILNFLGEQKEAVLAKEIADSYGINTQKILPILKTLIADGFVYTVEQKTKSAPLLYLLSDEGLEKNDDEIVEDGE